MQENLAYITAKMFSGNGKLWNFMNFLQDDQWKISPITY